MKFLRRVVKGLLWPFSRFFDPRFQGIATQVEQQAETFHKDLVGRFEEVNRLFDVMNRRFDAIAQTSAEIKVVGERAELALGELRKLLTANMEVTTEATTVFGRSLADLLGETDRLRELIDSGAKPLSDAHAHRLVDSRMDDLDEDVAKILNYAESHLGFAAQRNLWFNPPLSLKYEGGHVRLFAVNERIAEAPYVVRALAGLDPESTILDVGAAESTLAFSLATLGYRVTALDLHGYPLEHPNLRAVQAPIHEWATDETFDAVICLSTIEHIGLGAYGEPKTEDRADLEAMRRIRELTAPGGLLILTVPFGRTDQTDLQRTYDRDAFQQLLEGWDVEDLTVIRQADRKTWVRDDAASPNDGARVALATARHP